MTKKPDIIKQESNDRRRRSNVKTARQNPLEQTRRYVLAFDHNYYFIFYWTTTDKISIDTI